MNCLIEICAILSAGSETSVSDLLESGENLENFRVECKYKIKYQSA